MTEEKFEMIKARQMPDAEKRRRADFIIETDFGLDHARRQVKTVIEALKARVA
jgi:dephospho-CoA kinase